MDVNHPFNFSSGALLALMGSLTTGRFNNIGAATTLMNVGSPVPDADYVLQPTANMTITINTGLAAGNTYTFFKIGGAGFVSFALGAGVTVSGVLPVMHTNSIYKMVYLTTTQVAFIPVLAAKTLVTAHTAGNIAANGTGAVVTGWTEVVDNTNSFNPATGVFVAPRAGQYRVSGQLLFNPVTVAANGRFGILVSRNGSAFGAGTPIHSVHCAVANPVNIVGKFHQLVNCAVNDQITIRAFLDTATAASVASNANFNFLEIEGL